MDGSLRFVKLHVLLPYYLQLLVKAALPALSYTGVGKGWSDEE